VLTNVLARPHTGPVRTHSNTALAAVIAAYAVIMLTSPFPTS